MSGWQTAPKTALLISQNGQKLYGYGIGATGDTVGEVCFNTAMTGYQEILTDPSYLGQLVTFTFPHIGNVGVNEDDNETSNSAQPQAAQGLIVREAITEPANYRSVRHFDS